MKLCGKILSVLLFFSFSLGLHSQTDYNAVHLYDSLQYIREYENSSTPFYVKKQLEIKESDLIKLVDMQPAFAVFKDIYFTTGIPLNTEINRNTADAMFQISIRQRLTKSVLPFNSFAFLTYTQKSFWDIYAESAPFRDSNYNPGIGIGRYIIKNGKLQGTAFVQIEHESNGKGGKDSRSWNSLSFSTKYFFNPYLTFGAKIWIPFVDGEENDDLIDYKGLGYASFNYLSKNNKWWISAELNPRKGWGNINTKITASFLLSKNHNQYLYARFFNGKGDSLLDYKKYNLNFRIGICIKPDFYSIF